MIQENREDPGESASFMTSFTTRKGGHNFVALQKAHSVALSVERRFRIFRSTRMFPVGHYHRCEAFHCTRMVTESWLLAWKVAQHLSFVPIGSLKMSKLWNK